MEKAEAIQKAVEMLQRYEAMLDVRISWERRPEEREALEAEKRLSAEVRSKFAYEAERTRDYLANLTREAHGDAE